MASSLASCISALAHAPIALRKNRSRSNALDRIPTCCTCSDGSTSKKQTRLSKLRHKGTIYKVYDATVEADDGLEKTSRNAGPRPVHFPNRCTNAASISHPADAKVPLPFKKGAATTTTTLLLEKQVSFQPRKSRRISPKNANIAGDNSVWMEILVVSSKKGSNKSRSLFYSIQTRHAFWDEPPTGASEVVFLGDQEKLNAVMARVEKQQQMYRDSSAAAAAREGPNGLCVGGDHTCNSVGSVGSVGSISTDSTSLTSASTVLWLSSHVGFLGESDANTSIPTTTVQTRMMLLLFAINVILLVLLCSMGGTEISNGGTGRSADYLMHAVFFQGMMLVWHLWPCVAIDCAYLAT